MLDSVELAAISLFMGESQNIGGYKRALELPVT